jgi:hypothetical protein
MLPVKNANAIIVLENRIMDRRQPFGHNGLENKQELKIYETIFHMKSRLAFFRKCGSEDTVVCFIHIDDHSF